MNSFEHVHVQLAGGVPEKLWANLRDVGILAATLVARTGLRTAGHFSSVGFASDYAFEVLWREV